MYILQSITQLYTFSYPRLLDNNLIYNKYEITNLS
jgi:hypothetical protein